MLMVRGTQPPRRATIETQLQQDDSPTGATTDAVCGYAYNPKVAAVDMVMLAIPVVNVAWATGMALRPLVNDAGGVLGHVHGDRRGAIAELREARLAAEDTRRTAGRPCVGSCRRAG
jgi:hypothetical protein